MTKQTITMTAQQLRKFLESLPSAGVTREMTQTSVKVYATRKATGQQELVIEATKAGANWTVTAPSGLIQAR